MRTYIPIVRTTEQHNREWKEAKIDERPFIVIEKSKGKPCTFKYDMFPIPHDLGDYTVARLNHVFDIFCAEQVRDSEEGQKPVLSKSFYYGFGNVIGSFPFKRLEDGRVLDLITQINTIIGNKENWTDIKGTDMAEKRMREEANKNPDRDGLLRDNWNRMTELSGKEGSRTKQEEAEYRYRLSVQNAFATTGIFDLDYTPSKNYKGNRSRKVRLE